MPESILPIQVGPLHFMVEDALNAFVFTGIVSVAYQVVHRERLVPDEKLAGGARYACRVVAMVSLPFVWLGMNAIFATTIGFLSGTIFMVIRRRDLVRVSLWSGGLALLTMLTSYFVAYSLITNSDQIIPRFWHYTYTEQWGKWGVLAVELLWAFSFGTLFGPLYAFGRRMRYV